jgi:CHASE2 domain-containing sensor protein
LAGKLRWLLRHRRCLDLGSYYFQREPPKRKLGAMAAVFILAFIFGLWADGTPIGIRLETLSYDSRLLWTSRQPLEMADSLRSILVDMAASREISNSLRALGDASVPAANSLTFPWPRFIYGRLVRELKAQGAVAVAFDVLFAGPRPEDPMLELKSGKLITSDEFFAGEIGQAGNVLLALSPAVDPNSHANMVIAPLELLAANARDIGLVDLIFDPDHVVRRMPAYLEVGNRRVWDLGLLLAAKGLGLDLQNATIEQRRIVCRGPNGLIRIIPLDDQKQMLPAWSLTWPEIKKQSEISLANLLAQDYGRQRLGGGLSQGFQNKLVIIGAQDAGVNVFHTPTGPAPEIALFLNSANSMITGRFVSQYSAAVILLMTALSAGLSLAGFWTGFHMKNLIQVAAFLLLQWGAGFVALAKFLYWLPLIAPSLAALGAAMMLRIYCYFLARLRNRLPVAKMPC